MEQSEFAKVVAVALEIAGYADRGLGNGDRDTIRETMEVRDVDSKYLTDVMLLTDAFLSFAMNVRAAAIKGRPITPVHGETDLPR